MSGNQPPVSRVSRNMKALGCAASVAMCGLLLVGCGSSAPEGPAAQPTAVPDTASERAKERPPRPQPGEVTVGGRTLVGEWEQGVLLGRPLVLEGREVLYAAQVEGGPAYVATGVRAGARLLRTITVVPDLAAVRGIALYGGNVLGDRGPDDRVTDGSYLVVGVVPGHARLTVAAPEGTARPVSGRSVATAPGHTAFFAAGDWADDWDQVQLAPLTIGVAGGPGAPVFQVRERSWVG